MRRLALVTSWMVFSFGCTRSHDVSSSDGACRWRIGDAVEIARSGRIDGLAGAVHATRDAALVIASTETGPVGALVTTSERAERLASFEPSRGADSRGGGAVHSTEVGFILSTYPDCTIDLVGDDLAAITLDLAEDVPDAHCVLSQSAAGRIEVAIAEGSDGPTTIRSVTGLGTAEQVVEDLGGVGAPDAHALRVVHQPSWGTWVWVYGSRGYAIERLDGASPATSGWWFPSGLMDATADHRRGGIVIVARRDPPSGEWAPWQLEHFGPDGDLDAPVVTTLPDVWPSEGPAGTEDGALIPIHVGRLAVVRWGEPGLEILRHDDSDRVLQSRAIVRPGGDVGGLLYTMTDAGTTALRWRPLLCD